MGPQKEASGLREAGGVFGDSRGELLGSYAKHMGSYTLVKTDLKVILWGLRLARERGLQKLYVNLDSLVIVGFLQGIYQTPLEHFSLIQQCTNLLSYLGW